MNKSIIRIILSTWIELILNRLTLQKPIQLFLILNYLGPRTFPRRPHHLGTPNGHSIGFITGSLQIIATSWNRDSLVSNRRSRTVASWWLHQPPSSPIFGVNMKNIWVATTQLGLVIRSVLGIKYTLEWFLFQDVQIVTTRIVLEFLWISMKLHLSLLLGARWMQIVKSSPTNPQNGSPPPPFYIIWWYPLN